MNKALLLGVVGACVLLSGCNRNPLLVTRSLCPAVAVPTYTGDVTRFTPEASRDADAIDYTATITNLRGACTEGADRIVTAVTFDVVALRRNPAGARDVTLPFFASVVQGGNVLVSKQVGSVTLRFADGQRRAQAAGAAQSGIARAAVTLPAEVQEKITRKRRPEEIEALIDPLAAPEVRAAVRARSFEVLVGFQLDDAALAYNVRK